MAKPSRASTVLTVVVVVVLGCVGLAGPAGAQTEPSVPELIVPGDTTVTTAPAVTGGGADLAPADDSGTAEELTPATATSDGLAASTKVWIIIGGLVGLAFVIMFMTILYWRRTKPAAVAARTAASGASTATDPAPGDLDWAQEPAPTPSPAVAAPAPTPAPSPARQPAPQPAPSAPVTDAPRPVGDVPLDPRRSVFAPPLGDEQPRPDAGGTAPPQSGS